MTDTVKCKVCSRTLTQPHDTCLRCEREDAELDREVMTPFVLQETLKEIVARAESIGLVITITQKPKKPLAMGNYETVVEVRDSNSTYRSR